MTLDISAMIQAYWGFKYVLQNINFYHRQRSFTAEWEPVLIIGQEASIQNSLFGLQLGSRIKLKKTTSHPYLRLGSDLLYSSDERFDHTIWHNDEIRIEGTVENDLQNDFNLFIHLGFRYEMELKKFKTYIELQADRALTYYEFKTRPRQFGGKLKFAAMSYGLVLGIRI